MIDVMSELINGSGLSQADLMKIVETAPRRYKVFEIPKRSGGTREIAQPAREVKLLQRILMDVLLCNLPVHRAAFAYRTGKSILDNANVHRGAGPILKMDFEEFFPSFRSEDWEAFCDGNNILSAADTYITSRILFRRKKGEQVLRLSIGAPSSPMLSNILMREFDILVEAEAHRRRIEYSRYADDLTFSGQRIGMLKDMVDVVAAVSSRIKSPRLRVNTSKTTFVTAKHRRTVTGIVLSNDSKAGLGHVRKRQLSAKVHWALLGRLSDDQIIELAGLLSFANAIEPAFLDWLREKYGSRIVEEIKAKGAKSRTLSVG